jgi:DUF177 domain-containing protein
MLDRLPDLVDPIAFAERRRELTGKIKIKEFKRLSELLADNQGEILLDASFYKSGRLAIIQGKISGELTVTCQSCMSSMIWPIDIGINLGVVASLEQADLLASEYEPLLLEEDKISLLELVEDELLIALPDFPRHDFECMESKYSPTELPVDNKQTMSENPFSVLAKLKNTGD